MKFFEVFDMLTADAGLKAVFEEVAAIKVAASKLTGNITVHIETTHPLPHREKKKMLSLLKKQLFIAAGEVSFAEVCHLSAQYNQENLWSACAENFLDELAEKSTVLAGIVKGAGISFNGSVMTLSLPDSFINREKSVQVGKFFESLYRERFGFELRVSFEYIPIVETVPTAEYEFVPVPERLRAVLMAGKGKGDEIGGKPVGYKEDSSHMAQKKTGQGASKEDGTGGLWDAMPAPVTAELPKKIEAEKQNKMPSGGQQATAKVPAQASSGAPAKDTSWKGKFSGGAYNKGKFGRRELPEDPSIFYGRAFDGETIPISEVQDEIGDVVLRGKILKLDVRELKNEKLLYIFSFTDFTDTIQAKLFVRAEQKEELSAKLKEGAFIKIKGMAMLDKYDHEISVTSVVGIKEIPNFIQKRKDESPVKRVELHAHTTYSDMDAVVSPEDLVKTAFAWGHPGIAITDHGVVQAFPVANHAIDIKTLKNEEDIARAKAFKIIYGMEAYLVDDLEDIVRADKGQPLKCPAVVFDIETTGFSNQNDKIIEIGAVKVVDGTITEKFSTFVNPQVPIPFEIEKLTSITDEMVMGADTIDIVLPKFLAFCEGCILVAHNARFDTGFIAKNARDLNLPADYTIVDTVGLARVLLPELHNFKLDTVAKELSVSLENHHRAVDDAGCTAEIYVKFLQMMEERGYKTLHDINERAEIAPDIIKKMRPYHTILLCRNDIGRINLYRMVSASHLEYFQRSPRIPKSMLKKYREGLIVGSACEAGELYQAILRGESADEINRLCEFYDYYEIQPLGNNRFMVEDPKTTAVQSEDDLIAINKKIISLGEQYNKLVVATCDVHFLNPEDEVYRRIIMNSKGFKDADNQAPLFLRTTEEMLNEFRYLSTEKAEELVITNPRRIMDMVEKISPVRPDKCAPVIPNSDETLRNICYDKAHAIYGPKLPPQVEGRLEHELNSIIKNGFAVMYIIAQKLVWKSNEDGYLVGSRGSVGSSFVATMSGITEVNPLPPHYYCEKCHYADFDSEAVKPYAMSCGCDMPDRVCPQCGQMLIKDGHNIPFETFLGFNGDKEPDIDLNFSGEYQSKAHEYTEVIFGAGHTFRAGTIGTVADKTAFGYVKKYNEEHEKHQRPAEMERIALGCTGVRRSTGQHPGGIVVLPHGEDINSFTPLQHPANDTTTKIVTTHFEYHSIDHNLLKLDILGHDDPTMIKVLEDFTGIDAKKIRMDDPKVISLFASTEALGITPADISGCDLGSLGLPELGTDFVMQMLRDTRPQSFSDMIRISGLSHGTDVWLNNTQTLIQEGTCTLSTAICTRDDIMTYLIQMGIENGHAFKIMESVRKGKGVTDEMEAEMLSHGVPDWYIWSCRRIKYMFPKAHACAYVMMAFRIAYFKVYYPLAYYAAYFSIRASAFNYELMCLGKERLRMHMAEYKRRMNSSDFKEKLSQKEEDTYKDMKLVEEMYARGYEFEPIDLFKVKAHAFQIVSDKKIMPCLSTIEGLGDKAADQIVEAVAFGPFLSREDFRDRCKVSQTNCDKMAELGLLGDIPISNQISLLDFLGA